MTRGIIDVPRLCLNCDVIPAAAVVAVGDDRLIVVYERSRDAWERRALNYGEYG